MSFTVVSLAIGSIYENYVQQLIQSMEKVGIPDYKIYRDSDKGSWEKNCQYKAVVLRQALEIVKTPVVWIDADAQFNSYPHLFDEISCDFAHYYFPRTKEYLSGTLYLDNNAKVKSFLDKWISVNEKNDRWDQINMKNVLLQQEFLSVKRLPVEYCKIFDNIYQECKNPVIIHGQASRVAKRLRI
jgi:hypothetical protein